MAKQAPKQVTKNLVSKKFDTGRTRPTKKQYQTLEYIRHFTEENGYSPSYREIMRGCNYTSVATVALHVKNLITRGHLIKRNNSARSLEIIGGVESANKSVHKMELITEIENRFSKLEKEISEEILNEIYVLVGALKVLGHVDVARDYAGRITQVSNAQA